MNLMRLRVDFRSLLLWGHAVRIAVSDTGYLLHAALRAVFGPHAPQPFRLFDKSGLVLGYGTAGEKELRDCLARCGEEPLRGVFSLPGPGCKTFPEQWRSGVVLRFETLACPLRRFKSTEPGREGRVQERDAFVAASEYAGSTGGPMPERTEVYQAWLSGELDRGHAALLHECRLKGFRMVRFARRGATDHAGAPRALRGMRPEAYFEGVLSVNDPGSFADLLARGVGRHRAFGYGMLLVRA